MPTTTASVCCSAMATALLRPRRVTPPPARTRTRSSPPMWMPVGIHIGGDDLVRVRAGGGVTRRGRKSAVAIAEQHTDAVVVGIDRSQVGFAVTVEIPDHDRTRAVAHRQTGGSGKAAVAV